MSTTDRYDIYAPIHKALRQFMTDTLQRLGRLDLDDQQDLLLGDGVEAQSRRTDVGQRIGDREAVDVVGVLGGGRTTEAAHVRGAAVVGGGVDHARRQQGDGIDVAGHRDFLQLLGGEHGAAVGLGDVDDRNRTGGYRHGAEGGGAAKVDLRARCHQDRDVAGIAACGHLVTSGRQ